MWQPPCCRHCPRHERSVHPCFGDDLFVAEAPDLAIQLAEAQHFARSVQVAALQPCGVACPTEIIHMTEVSPVLAGLLDYGERVDQGA